MFQLIPALREKSCLRAVLRVNLWVKFRYSGIGFFGIWDLFLAYKNEITWSVLEHTFSHYYFTPTFCNFLLTFLKFLFFDFFISLLDSSAIRLRLASIFCKFP